MVSSSSSGNRRRATQPGPGSRRPAYTVLVRLVPEGRSRTAWRVARGAMFGALLLLPAIEATTAEVRVQMSGTQVDLEATAAPLAEILDRLARLTGMELEFDGAAPRPLVTISLHGRSPAETVLAVLEGLGINFALIADDSGIQVEKLLVTGTASPSSSSAPSPPFRGNRSMPAAPPEPIEPFEDESLPPDELGMPGNEPESEPGGEPVMPGPVPDEPVPPGEPAISETPQPYAPSAFLPPAPTTVQPLQPFPQPTPSGSPPP
jgi:hypothetical protein